MSLFNRILFAVKDTDPRRGGALTKVIALAKASGATLELYHAVASPVYLPDEGSEVSIDRLKEDTVELHLSRLEKTAQRARRHGVETVCTVTWDHPAHEAIVRRARDTDAALIVAEAHEGAGKRWLMRFTDWELVKTSECPVLLLRTTSPYRRPVVLAAVDPLHQHAKPLDLDEHILTAGRSLSAVLRGKLHVLHANHPTLQALTGEGAFSVEDARTRGRLEFARLMNREDIAGRQGHLVDGDPVKVIPKMAEKLGARVVVMGAVSRSGLKRLFIGNTAERVLDKLACDVLVVKPDEFRRRVPAKARDTLVLTPAPSSVRLS